MAVLTRYGTTAGAREDVLDLISQLTPEDTSVYSRLGISEARSAIHSWLTDTIASGTATGGATVEGATAVSRVLSDRNRLTNYTQITTETIDISGTQEATGMYGVESEYGYRLEQGMKRWKIMVDIMLINSTSASGDSSTARQTRGILDAISTNTATGSGGASALTESAFNSLLQTIFENGGNPNIAFPAGFNKRRISSFSTPNVRFQEPGSEGKVQAFVSVYESDFGDIEIVKERYMLKDSVPVLELKDWRVAYLRRPFVKPLSDIGDSKRAMIIGEYCLEYLAEVHSGKLSGFATS